MEIVNNCPKCGDPVFVKLLKAKHYVTDEVAEQPVLMCDKGHFVVPYLGAEFNKISPLGVFYHFSKPHPNLLKTLRARYNPRQPRRARTGRKTPHPGG